MLELYEVSTDNMVNGYVATNSQWVPRDPMNVVLVFLSLVSLPPTTKSFLLGSSTAVQPSRGTGSSVTFTHELEWGV